MLQQYPWLVIVFWMALTGIINYSLRVKTPEQWVALADQRPRLHAAIRVLRAMGLDPAKLIEALRDMVSAKAKIQPANDNSSAEDKTEGNDKK